jgi:putative transposase
MSLAPPRRRRKRAPRLPGFDYSTLCAYFVSFNTARRRPILARIVDGRSQLTRYGRHVAAAWRLLLADYPTVRIRAGVIMPDHVHVLIVLLSPVDGRRPTVPDIVSVVKTHSTRLINADRGTPMAPVWQRSFNDWIIRTPASMERVVRYIRANPRRWWLTQARGRRRCTGPSVPPRQETLGATTI